MPDVNLGIDDEVAVVTGGNEGVGSAIASDIAPCVTGATYRIDGGGIPSMSESLP